MTTNLDGTIQTCPSHPNVVCSFAAFGLPGDDSSLVNKIWIYGTSKQVMLHSFAVGRSDLFGRLVRLLSSRKEGCAFCVVVDMDSRRFVVITAVANAVSSQHCGIAPLLLDIEDD